MKLIVGLGNPGARYSGTRHNVGFMVTSRLADRWDISLSTVQCRSKVGRGRVGPHAVGIAQPHTMMNESGEAVGCLLRRLRLEKACALVVCDDVALALGAIRLRRQGSDGGHNGLSSIIESLQSQEIPRLRVGIRTPEVGEELTAFVLGRFRSSDKKALEEGLDLAVEACEAWVTQGVNAAMNSFNRRVPCRT